MKHSWTGGQYSVWRAVLAGAVLLETARIGVGIPTAVAAVLCLALLVGWKDRFAALLLAIQWIALHVGPNAWAVATLLVLHALTRRAPFGSLEARGRGDPGGNWILPDWNYAARWMLFGAVFAADQASLGGGVMAKLMGDAVEGGRALHATWWIPVGAVFALLLDRRARPWWWTAALLLEIWERRNLSPAPWTFALALVHLATLDPGWLPRLRGSEPARVFFDGTCGLCHRLVRFALAEDRSGRAFRFAPLQGATFASAMPAEARRQLPDTFVVLPGDGRVLIRSRASRHVLARLGGLWRAVGIALSIVPPFLLDLGYDAVARVRFSLFARPEQACPVVPPHLRRRFDP